ncbi:uncharacterized protein LOC121416520 [Lytechinus variegatus]|uniref:uncharacterized protein LOC121416520 n=1 Tax=Lytechinus variegatus TaxID=7654 RepID=UPI001BB150EF|nr:uncharacterized protein LOC121416520 [Lytechinus variegatus]
MKCCMHVCKTLGKTTQPLRKLSVISWTKFRKSAERWKRAHGVYSWTAEKVWDAFNLDENEDLKDDISARFGFHRQCYQRFTCIAKIARAERKLEKQLQQQHSSSLTQSITSDDTSKSQRKENLQSTPVSAVLVPQDNAEPPAKRLHRSPVTISSEEERKHIEGECCIICKSNRYYREWHSGKRLRERLSTCQTPNARSLLEKAARGTGNQTLLLELQERDVNTSKLLYHSSCYSKTTRKFTKSYIPNENPTEPGYRRSFEQFCKDVIDTKVIKNKEVLNMKTLLQMFIKCVKDVQKLDASSYRVFSLKKRLQKTYPQLQFVQPPSRRKSQLVMVRGVQCPDTRDSLQPPDRFAVTSHDLDSDLQSDVSTGNDERLQEKSSSQEIQDTYKYVIARSLRDECLACKSSPTWLPQKNDLSLDASTKELIPTKLFNFLAVLVGASDEPVEDGKINVPDIDERRIVPLAQDIMHAVRNRFPKH